MKVAFVLGEVSADRIGADLLRALRQRTNEPVEAVGLGGSAMADEGLQSLFDIEELSIIGVGAIVSRLPFLVKRLNETVRHIVAEAPDVLITIDSFTFTNRVALKVRQALPGMAIVNLVPPAVWAYRPGRVEKLTAAVDHTICLFPFEPEVFARLGGPPATYVGHPLTNEPHLERLGRKLAAEGLRKPANPPRLLILPGSRRGEVERLSDDFGRTYAFLKERHPEMTAVIPSVDRVRSRIEAKVASWAHKPEIVSGEAAKWKAFEEADAALAASGTVALELALAGVPTVIAYRLDPMAYRLRHLITGWTAVLPNLVVDHPLVPEHFHEFVRADLLGRRIERLLFETPERAAQLAGFAEVHRRMAVDRPAADAAADIVLEELEKKRALRKH